MVVIFLVGAWLRLTSFDFKLPYIDHPDEPSLYVETLAKRGVVNPIPNLTAYPPAVLVQTDLVLRLLERSGYPSASDVVHINRLLSVVSNLVTLVLIGLLARAIAGSVAGLVAALAWAISPLVLENGVYGLADPPVYMLATLSVYLAIIALLRPERRHWLIWSTVAALVATLYKYPAVVMLFPGGVVALWLLRKDRRLIRVIIIQALLVGVVAFYLFGVHGAGNMDMPVVNNSRAGLLDNLFTPDRLLSNLWWLASPLNAEALFVILLVGGLALGYAAVFHRPKVRRLPLLLCALTLLVVAWIVSGFSTSDTTGRIRDIMLITPLACVLMGAAVAQVLLVFPKNARYFVGVGLAVVLYLFVFQAQWANSLLLVEEREVVDRRVALYRYVDTNLDPGTIIVNESNYKTFNPFYSGLQGQHWYDWQETKNLMQRPISEWIRHGLSYAAVTTSQYDELQETEEGRSFLGEMLYLRTLNDPPDGDGPITMMYRLWKMDHEVDIHFSEGIRLVGYDSSATTIRPGETLELRFYWRADTAPTIDYSLFVHLNPAGELMPMAQIDGAPARPERLTPTWNDPDETIISQPFSLPIPDGLEPGTYEVRVGLYDYVTGRRLTVEATSGEQTDSVMLFTVQIAPA